MGEITFALIREGTSDDGLVAHIRTLLIAAGADTAVGAPRSYKGSTSERLQQVWAEDDAVDLIFVHRDADDRDASPRHLEISTASGLAPAGSAEASVVVAVVPVQELEAWLLTDEAAIREAVGKPNRTTRLAIPSLNRIESSASPKEILRAACLDASETTGARHRREVRAFPQRRAALLDRLDIDGPINELPSWQRFVEDLKRSAGEVLLRQALSPSSVDGERT